MKTLCTVVLSLCVAATAAAQSNGSVLDHEKIGKDYATRLGLDPAAAAGQTLDAIYAGHFVHAELGAFRIEWPAHALPGRSGELKDCAEALIKGQEEWLDWIQLKASEQKAVRSDLALVAKWVHGWNTNVLARGKPGQNLVDIVSPSSAQGEALKRFNDAMQRLSPVGTPREQPRTVKLVFQPTRQDFAEFVYFAGWLHSDLRPGLWLDSVPDWTQCFVLDAQVIGLQYAATGRQPSDYTLGTWMNERDPDVMQQQVVQLGMNAWFLDQYEDRVPGAFVGGLSMNLVVDVYGVVNTRVDGDTRSKQTQKREVFIPGGASEGGQLAKNSAETRFRENQGKDHFLPTLRQAQREGDDVAKNDRNKVACFAVRNDAGGGKHLVKAPFLGSAAAATQAPPAEFLGDWAELLRSYKSAFIYWLQTAAVGNEKVSRERFAVLLRKLADPNLATDFEAVFQEVYDGAPLSNAEVDKTCLEGQFLRWLQKLR